MNRRFQAAALSLLFLALPSLAGDSPLTDENIVRLVITGVSHDRIIEQIRSSETDFDLSDEMVEEMKLVGVPKRIIQAMRDRHLELNPPAASLPDEVAPPALPALVVHLEFKKQPVLPKALPEEVAKQAGIPVDDAGRRITAAALFAACTSPTHVPDHWRSKSPLGRDFVFTPRHRVLLFQPAFEPGGDKEHAFLKLVLPESVRLDLESGEAHNLVFGLAVEAGGRYLAVFQLKLENLILEEGDIHRAVSVVQPLTGILDVTIKQIEYRPPEEPAPAD